ncbi:MAG: hypothetical protein JST80_11455 [Bdellovibrionales bacterium]|nr:hypothetical protein [Bdellovibrionales bacterium]
MNNENNKNELETQTKSQEQPPSGEIVTPASMVEFLLSSGLKVSEISEKIAVSDDFVKNALSADTVFNESNSNSDQKRLHSLYLRNRLKLIYRKFPFIGIKKAAQRLGVTQSVAQSVYDSLIGSGELKYKMTVPTWSDAESKEPLREHIVS